VGTVTVIACDYNYTKWRVRDQPEVLAVGAAKEQQRHLDQVAGHAERDWKKATDQGDVEASQRTEVKASKARKEAASAAEETAQLKNRVSKIWEPVHQRNAERLLWLCQTNAGCYVKIGQHLSQLDYVLPRAYTVQLSQMLDAAPRSSADAVNSTVLEELGQTPEELFDRFEWEPIASASLAQVHVAYEKETGRKLAVKVQHRGLAETAQGDLAVVSFITRGCARLFPEADFVWLAEEAERNLPDELDFVNEARNSERCAASFAADPAVIIPKILWPFTKKRVLTMEFEEGNNLTDLEFQRRHGISHADVSALLSNVFCRWNAIYSSYVHCN